MGLIDRIKRQNRPKERGRSKPSSFSAVTAILERFRPDPKVIEKPYGLPDPEGPAGSASAGFKAKERFEVPPFGLADRERFDLIKRILEKFDNPYLPFARSPDEITLSKPLNSLNPSISSDLLERFHFETLLLVELARKRIETLSEAAPDLSAGESPATGRCEINARIRSLMKFVLSVESSGGRTEEPETPERA